MGRTIGLLRKFQQVVPTKSLIAIYKTFIRLRLDYGDVIFDQAYYKSFHHRLKSTQYNAALAITGAIRRTSNQKLYKLVSSLSIAEDAFENYLFYK